MRYGICVYKDDIPAAERAGFDYVELTVTNVLPEVPDSEFRSLARYLESFDIRPEAWRRFLTADYPVVGEHVDEEKLAGFLEITLSRISELGGSVVVFGSPVARNIPEAFPAEKARAQVEDFLGLCAEHAKEYDITVVIEPITPENTNHIHTIAEAVDIARAVNSPHIKVLADLFHMSGSGDSVEAVRRAGELLRHVHLPIPDIEGLNEPRAITDKLAGYPVADFLGELKTMGYDTRISIEDLDRKFMNLEREAPIVLQRVRELAEREPKAPAG
jgi:sugar phosphate isomerase/epimerase